MSDEQNTQSGRDTTRAGRDVTQIEGDNVGRDKVTHHHHYPPTPYSPRGIPSDLVGRLREILLDCDSFDTDQQVREGFKHEKLFPWRDRLPQAEDVASRVDAVVAFLADTRENALVLLLRVLIERTDPSDECYRRLTQMAARLEAASTGYMEMRESLSRHRGRRGSVLPAEPARPPYTTPHAVPRPGN